MSPVAVEGLHPFGCRPFGSTLQRKTRLRLQLKGCTPLVVGPQPFVVDARAVRVAVEGLHPFGCRRETEEREMAHDIVAVEGLHPFGCRRSHQAASFSAGLAAMLRAAFTSR